MISLRAHVVTIVAVFLALAIGLLVGGAFVDPVLEQQLRDRTEDLLADNGNLRSDLDDVRAELEELRRQVGSVDAFADVALPYLAGGRLLGASVVLIADEGLEDTVLGQAQRALAEADANLVAVISARGEITSEDPATQERLVEILDLVGDGTDTGPEELPARTAEALAIRLANGDDGAEPSDDVLAQLLSAGFLAPVGAGVSEATLDEIGSPGQVVVVLAGGQEAEPAVLPETFAVPLVRDLAELGVPVAAGESATTAIPFVALVRDGGIDGLVTVDDLDLSMGGAALVLGLDRLLSLGEGGAYGIKEGARLLPAPP